MKKMKHGVALTLMLAACGGSQTSTETPAPENAMMVIRVVVDVKPDQADAFVAYLNDEATRVRTLEGCERYELFRDPSGAARFLLYEEWASEDAFEAYKASPEFTQSFAVLGPMMAGPPDSSYFQARQTGP
ncbi:MAG: putative quinol monooxygenase [Myxococcota bacterium]